MQLIMLKYKFKKKITNFADLPGIKRTVVMNGHGELLVEGVRVPFETLFIVAAWL